MVCFEQPSLLVMMIDYGAFNFKPRPMTPLNGMARVCHQAVVKEMSFKLLSWNPNFPHVEAWKAQFGSAIMQNLQLHRLQGLL